MQVENQFQNRLGTNRFRPGTSAAGGPTDLHTAAEPADNFGD
jgi:hypothetical protein